LAFRDHRAASLLDSGLRRNDEQSAGVGWGERSEPQRRHIDMHRNVGVRLRLTPTYDGGYGGSPPTTVIPAQAGIQ